MNHGSFRVGFLHDTTIERAAYGVIASYTSQFGLNENDPIPVDSILESHLELTLEFEDLQAQFESSEVLGATWIEDRTVVIDQSLDPFNYPTMAGRYAFTVAHEIGHWQLHRPLFEAAEAQTTFFEDDRRPPSFVCRSSADKDPMEYQADKFASFLLMPRDRVIRVWESTFGNRNPYVIQDVRGGIKPLWSVIHPVTDVARQMAQHFKVSGQAMEYRLEKLGLILQDAPVVAPLF